MRVGFPCYTHKALVLCRCQHDAVLSVHKRVLKPLSSKAASTPSRAKLVVSEACDDSMLYDRHIRQTGDETLGDGSDFAVVSTQHSVGIRNSRRKRRQIVRLENRSVTPPSRSIRVLTVVFRDQYDFASR